MVEETCFSSIFLVFFPQEKFFLNAPGLSPLIQAAGVIGGSGGNPLCVLG